MQPEPADFLRPNHRIPSDPLSSLTDRQENTGEAAEEDGGLIMVSVCAKRGLLLTFLCVTFVETISAQYENYSFRSFPTEELMPLTATYGLALDFYAASNWTEAIRHLEISLRLRRLLRDSVRFCAVLCNSEHNEPFSAAAPDLRAFWRVLRTAACQRGCRAQLPALQLPPPGREIMEEFNSRSPYRFLHFAYSQVKYS